MSGADAAHAAAGFALGAALAALVARVRIRRAPASLVRINVAGMPVPAILGEPLIAGALGGLALVGALGPAAGGFGRAAAAVALVIAAMGAAGRYDDLRGDESPRGFRGHLAARRVTGGVVKVGAGASSGLLAGAVVGGLGDPLYVLEAGLLAALTANLMNLLDRAPGRAAKAWLLLAAPLAGLGPAAWTLAAAGLIGASLVCLVPDLRARAMLGDMGANPLGAAAGVGLALALARPGRLAAVVLIAALTAASERVSFSRVIDATPALRFVDRLGRK